ncbi:unnamed protein product [Brassica oleracea]
MLIIAYHNVVLEVNRSQWKPTLREGDDDEHIRHDCITAFEEEIDELKEAHEEL